ncbi:MAG: lytic transglycosylase domain-containing protein [Chitinophagales bacterium]|nr:lytic transglycosylase domain-containing protein [Chitinophagales bacterium]
MIHIQKKHWILAGVLLLIGVGITCATIFSAPKKAEQNIFLTTKNEAPGFEWINAPDSLPPSKPISIKGELYFAGERVPLEDPDVRERLERELQLNVYWHSNTLMAMKNANRYFPEAEKILKENGVPTDFKYLALIESGFRNETSPAGAVGFWQILKETGKIYGLQIDGEVDERYHSEKACIAACKMLKQSYEQLGNWTIAAAAYNLGPAGMKARCADQKTNNYYEMFFNPETSRYLFRMIAMKVIFSNPIKAGFDVKAEELYQPYNYETVVVDSSISSIADFAAQYGLKYKHIKILNPWLRDAKLTNKERKKYALRILKRS